MINELIEYIIKREDESTNTPKIWIDDRYILTTDIPLVIAKDEKVAAFMLELGYLLTVDDIETVYSTDEKDQQLTVKTILNNIVYDCNAEIKQYDLVPILSIPTATSFIYGNGIFDEDAHDKDPKFRELRDEYVARGYKFVRYNRTKPNEYKIEFILTEPITKFELQTPTHCQLMQLLYPQSED